MKPYEFMRFYHPKLGRFVYKHKGSGIIVDIIFKPMKSAVSSIFKKFAKPVANYQQIPTKILQCMLWFFMRKF